MGISYSSAMSHYTCNQTRARRKKDPVTTNQDESGEMKQRVQTQFDINEAPKIGRRTLPNKHL